MVCLFSHSVQRITFLTTFFINGTRIPAERVEIAAVYHSIISMVKLQARSAWDYYGEFFTGIFNSCRDFLSLAYANS